MTGRGAILTVVNFELPQGDYRVQYALRSNDRRVMFAIPTAPPGIPDADVIVLPFGEGVEWRDAWTFVRLGTVLWRLRATLDFAHYYSTKLILIGPILSRLVGVPSVVTVTGFGRLFAHSSWKYRVARVVYRLFFRLATRLSTCVLFQNRGDMDETLARFPRLRGKAHYVGSATPAVEPSAHEHGRPRVQVVHVARLLPSKGITDFIAVAEKLHGKPVDFVLAGDDSKSYPELKNQVATADERGVLRYVGRLDARSLAEVYAESDILLFLSYGEGMARVMLEGGMRGLCPVAYDIAANRDLVTAGRGFLVALGDIEGAARVVATLVGDRASLAANAEAYEQHIREHFGIEAFTKRLDEVTATISTQRASVAR